MSDAVCHALSLSLDAMNAIVTPRLKLRTWRESDLEPFAALNADRVVMEHFPQTLSREETRAMIARIEDFFVRNGYGLWAVEVPSVAKFIGYVGLNVPTFEAAFTPCVEIGWRIAAEHWGNGYATEAARAARDHAFGALGLKEIVSFTVPANVRSQAVMQRIGMTRDPTEDFDHPRLPEGHRLRRHVLYRLAASSVSLC